MSPGNRAIQMLIAASLERLTTKLSVAKDFSKFPAGRYESDGPHSAVAFRALLVKALSNGPVRVQLDGTMGFGSSFLEEAFGGLVCTCGFKAAELRDNLTFESSDPSLPLEIWSYIETKPEPQLDLPIDEVSSYRTMPRTVLPKPKKRSILGALWGRLTR